MYSYRNRQYKAEINQDDILVVFLVSKDFRPVLSN